MATPVGAQVMEDGEGAEGLGLEGVGGGGGHLDWMIRQRGVGWGDSNDVMPTSCYESGWKISELSSKSSSIRAGKLRKSASAHRAYLSDVDDDCSRYSVVNTLTISGNENWAKPKPASSMEAAYPKARSMESQKSSACPRVTEPVCRRAVSQTSYQRRDTAQERNRGRAR